MVRRKKKKLRKGRLLFALVLSIAVIVGIYQGTKITLTWLTSLVFDNDNFVEEVSGEVIGTVILDAGHGGSDVGCNKDDIYEKDINLRYVQEIGNYLMKNSIQVYYTRKDDSRLADEQNADLQARCNIGQKYKADFFISIHINSHDTEADVSGFEVYYSDNDENSYTLATNVSNSMEELNYSRNRGVLEGNSLYVIRNNLVSPILIELGYINSADLNYLLDDSKTEKLSHHIAEGIIKTIKDKE